MGGIASPAAGEASSALVPDRRAASAVGVSAVAAAVMGPALGAALGAAVAATATGDGEAAAPTGPLPRAPFH